jgi:hypothetical protein
MLINQAPAFAATAIAAQGVRAVEIELLQRIWIVFDLSLRGKRDADKLLYLLRANAVPV